MLKWVMIKMTMHWCKKMLRSAEFVITGSARSPGPRRTILKWKGEIKQRFNSSFLKRGCNINFNSSQSPFLRVHYHFLLLAAILLWIASFFTSKSKHSSIFLTWHGKKYDHLHILHIVRKERVNVIVNNVWTQGRSSLMIRACQNKMEGNYSCFKKETIELLFILRGEYNFIFDLVIYFF